MEDAVLSVLQGGGGGKGKGHGDNDNGNGIMTVKKLRKMVLLSRQMDDDKTAKKDFKRTVTALEEAGQIQLNADGHVSLKSKKSSSNKKKRKKKEESASSSSSSSSKRKRVDDDKQKAADNDGNEQQQQQQQQQKEKDGNEKEAPSSSFNNDQNTKNKNAPCPGNPQGVTRLFLGNLPFSVDEASLQAFFQSDNNNNCIVTHIRWITDKETGKFYGSAFIEVENSRQAARAVSTKSGQELLGRPVKITFAPSRPGDIWPPPKKVVTGGNTSTTPSSGGTSSGAASGPSTPGASKTTTGGQAGGKGITAMGVKPANCVKLFIGNLSYDIDDEAMKKFFGTVDADVKALRWLHHKDSGDFKGCGYAEFWNTEACEKAATLNGKNLLGRPIRIDWTD